MSVAVYADIFKSCSRVQSFYCPRGGMACNDGSMDGSWLNGLNGLSGLNGLMDVPRNVRTRDMLHQGIILTKG